MPTPMLFNNMARPHQVWTESHAPPHAAASSGPAPRPHQAGVRMGYALIAAAFLLLIRTSTIVMAVEDDDFVLASLVVKTNSTEPSEDDEMELSGGMNLGLSFEGEDEETVTTAGLLVGTLQIVTDDGVALEIRLTALGVEVSWPAVEGPYQLEFKLDLSSVDWDPLDGEIEVHEDIGNGRYYIILPLSGGMQFLRLSR